MRRLIGWAAAVLCCLPVMRAEAVSVSAASAILYEPVSGQVLFEKDAHTPRPMASTTKLMTALVAARADAWDKTVRVTAEMVAVEGTALGLRAGDTLTLRDAVCGMLLVSGNDAANAVALTLSDTLPGFVRKMTDMAAELGMRDTGFATPSGLDGEGHQSSAYDMALLGAAVLNEPVLSEICQSKTATVVISGRKVTVKNHNRLLSMYDGAVGLKTGFTKKAGRCLVSAARRDGVTLIAVTLNDGDDWNDHMNLFDYGFSAVHAVALPPPTLPPLPVAGGESPSVALYTETPALRILPVGEGEQGSVSIRLPRFVWAPVQAGDTVGEVVYYLDGEAVLTCPVTAKETVSARPLKGQGERFWDNVRLLIYGLIS